MKRSRVADAAEEPRVERLHFANCGVRDLSQAGGSGPHDHDRGTVPLTVVSLQRPIHHLTP